MSNYKKVVFDFKGLDELQEKIDLVVKNLPYESEFLLTKTANSFRNSVKEKTPVGKDGVETTNGTNKKKRPKIKRRKNGKRRLIQRYKVRKPETFGNSIKVDFRSTAPHYHLIERGHEIVYQGVRTGKRTKAFKMVEKTSHEFETKLPQNVERYVNKVVKRLK